MGVRVWVSVRGGGVVCLEVEVVHVRLPVRRLDATYNVHEHAEPGHDDDPEDEAHLSLLLGTYWCGGSFNIPHQIARRWTRTRGGSSGGQRIDRFMSNLSRIDLVSDGTLPKLN